MSVIEKSINDVVGEALIDGSPRLITALAPVLVHRAGSLNLPKLYAALHALGLERRLAWVVENTLLALDALATESGSDARSWAKQRRRAAVPFRLFIDLVGPGHGAPRWEGPPDALDPTIRSVRTLEEVTRQASPGRQLGTHASDPQQMFLGLDRQAERVEDVAVLRAALVTGLEHQRAASTS